jgi:ribosome-associated translation inhibitor RaiA
MTLTVNISSQGMQLSPEVERRTERLVHQLDRRLIHFSEPNAILRLRQQEAQRLISVDLRVDLGSRADSLISHQSADTADHAVRRAVEDVERQLERRLAVQRGEPTFGVPSRRLPKSTRPKPFIVQEAIAGEEASQP